jgi:hypothetical protein
MAARQFIDYCQPLIMEQFSVVFFFRWLARLARYNSSENYVFRLMLRLLSYTRAFYIKIEAFFETVWGGQITAATVGRNVQLMSTSVVDVQYRRNIQMTLYAQVVKSIGLSLRHGWRRFLVFEI